MAVLNDGEQFLLEHYSLALTPGLQLVNPKPIEAQALRVLTAGLSESRQGFSSLPNVVEEVQEIQNTVPATVLLNNEFTSQSFENRLTYEGTPIVHMATLWQVNDEATALLMSQFYNYLATKTMTKAEALRNAQLSVLREPKFREHPFFWAPYVLLGNWL